MLFIYHNGETNYMCYRDKELFVLPTNKENEHDDPIISIDVSEHQNLQVSVDKEGLIKVWNEVRDLVREIKFNDEVASVAFASSS